MVASTDDGAWLDPKWLVTGVAVVAFALIASYDLRLGIAAGALLGGVAVFWLYFALRYGSLSGAPSGHKALVAQVRQQMANRRQAARRSGTQQDSDLTEGS